MTNVKKLEHARNDVHSQLCATFTLTCAIVVTCFTTNPHVDKNIVKGIIWTITIIYIYEIINEFKM